MRFVKGMLGALLMLPVLASAEEIGQVSTVFKFVGLWSRRLTIPRSMA
jgi:CreA protein